MTKEKRKKEALKMNKNIINKIKNIVIIMAFCLAVLFFYDRNVNYYDMNGVVYQRENDVFILLDDTDNLWEIDYTDTLNIGDKVKITFYTNRTDEERIDDIITTVIAEK